MSYLRKVFIYLWIESKLPSQILTIILENIYKNLLKTSPQKECDCKLIHIESNFSNR